MLRPHGWLVSLAVLSSLTFPCPHPAGGNTFQCTTGDSTTVEAVVTGQFHVYRPGLRGFDITWRDLEFMWGVSYPDGLSQDATRTLDRMASTLVIQKGKNPFGAALSKIHLDYNYFSLRGATYDATNPADSTSMAIEHATSGYTNADKSHSDVYLMAGGPGQWPAVSNEAAEDTSTGHPVNLANPQATNVKVANSISAGGPGIGFHLDLTGNGWTHPDAVGATTFAHEFQHSINPLWPSGGSMMDEMFSAAAEAVCGASDTTTGAEVPYTWPLIFRHHRPCSDCCQNPRDAVFSNYQGRSLFTAYLAYNFRGADTTATPDGLNDDLLRRWARQTVDDGRGFPTRHMAKLVELLGDDSCGTCVGKNYFRTPSGDTLPRYDRAQLLHHNWRVANYVNRSDLPGTEGQYGFPPQFGFSPGKNLKAWQDFDNCRFDDLVAIPPVVTLTNSHATQEMNLRVKREYRDNWHSLTLSSSGAEYWVVRADTASLGATPRDLVITVSSDSIFRSRTYGQRWDGRLVASVVAYTHRAPDADESPQWQNPQWAQLALQPKWADTDSLPEELAFVVPSFGLAYKAAVLVLSLGDGPSRAFETSALGWDGSAGALLRALPYRVSLALRGAPNDTLPNPRGLHQDSLVVADHPTWSPASDEVAFARSVPATGESRIYRQRLDGSPASPLLSGWQRQSFPDWSPRGDWVALAQDSGTAGNQRDIWLCNPAGGSNPQRRTHRPGLASWPAFAPNGQQIAYVYFPIIDFGVLDLWELRRVDVSGANDVPLLAPGGIEISSVRWSPDGLWIYFTRQDSLYAISSTTGQVVAHPEMLTNVASFDFHLSGTNRFAAEQTGNAGSLKQVFPTPVAFRRLVLRDTTATDTRARFYRTGAEFYHPRWSPNGNWVAYSSNQNTANLSTDRDLFVGQVSYNQPPQFQTVGDYAVNPSQTYQMTLVATDPDGETLTYDMPAAFLPPGSTFDPGTRTLTWPSPGPQGSNHFVVVRAMDPSGGVASRVIKLTVKLNAIADFGAELVSSTAVWPVWSAPGEGSFQGVEYDLRYAPYALNESNFTVANRRFVAAPGPPGEPEEAVVSGLTPSSQYWFAIKTKDVNGHWSAISNVFSVHTLSSGGGGGFSAQERGPVLAGRVLAESERTIPALIVEMGLDQGAPVWTLRQLGAEDAVALGANDSVSVLYQARDQAGDWVTRGRILAADADWRFGVRAFRRPGRVVFFGPYGVRQAWSSVAIGGSDMRASLVTAQHSRLGDLEGTFDGTGSTSLEVTSGDTLVLAYRGIADEAPAAPWFLLVGPPGSEVIAPAFARPEVGRTTTTLPTAFALRQNQPNPFALTTDIRFELPVQTTARLAVFDLLGRRIATLAEGSFPAGFHTVSWDRRDATHARAKPGIYLYRLEAGSFRAQKKMTILP